MLLLDRASKEDLWAPSIEGRLEKTEDSSFSSLEKASLALPRPLVTELPMISS